MKVERKESKFEPIVIILESQFEVDVLKEVVGSIGGSGEAREFTSSIYYALCEYSSTDDGDEYSNSYFSGTLQVKRRGCK